MSGRIVIIVVINPKGPNTQVSYSLKIGPHLGMKCSTAPNLGVPKKI